MILILGTYLIGIFRYRYWTYWKWALILTAWWLILPFLLQGGGTLSNPYGDGLLARPVRQWSNDGPFMALYGVSVITVIWGGTIVFIRKMYNAVQRRKADQEAGEETPPIAPVGRRFAEAGALLLVAGTYAYWMVQQVTAARAIASPSEVETTAEAPEITVTAGKDSNVDAADPIAKQLVETAAEITRGGEQHIDPITTLASVSAEGRVLTYHYRMLRRDASDNDLIAFVKKNNFPKLCAKSETRKSFDDYGITYRYSYLFPRAKTPVVVDANSAVCERLGSVNLGTN